MSDWFDRVYLEQEQRDLLESMIDADNAVPREQRHSFVLSQTSEGDFLIRAGMTREPISLSDLTTLAERHLVRVHLGSGGNRLYDVTPEGRRYHAEMKRRSGEAVGHVEAEIRRLLDSESFRSEYGEAYRRWREAADELWDADSDLRFTDIGHKCREALQLFATALLQRTGISHEEAPSDPTKTVDRIRTAIRHQRRSPTDARSAVLDAQLVYWGTVSDLVQRQEHGALKEGEPLVWEDARRVVFQTAIVMYELARTLR
jgi:hypothetical protein